MFLRLEKENFGYHKIIFIDVLGVKVIIFCESMQLPIGLAMFLVVF